MCCKRNVKKIYAPDQEVDDYIEPTNENDYTDYPKLQTMSRSEKEKRLLDLW
jgi:hypothetical protein